MPSQNLRRRADGVGGLGLAVQVGVRGDAVEKVRKSAIPHRGLAGIPALVIAAPDQLGELGGELRSLVDRKAISEGMQVGPQNSIGLLAIVGSQLVCPLVEPDVGLLDALLDDRDLGYVPKLWRAR